MCSAYALCGMKWENLATKKFIYDTITIDSKMQFVCQILS